MKGIISRFITKLVYPDGLCCVICDNELSDGKGLCKDCSPTRIVHYCNRCGNWLSNELQAYCDKCLMINSSIYFDEARAAFAYSDECVQKIVWKLKYGNAPYVADVMAEQMLETLTAQSWSFDIITYVPMHPKKERKRQYNQAKLIAQSIANKTEKPMISTLDKITNPPKSATKLGKEERIRLLSGSFALNGADIRGKSILLIDDVLTSKATANECTKMLKLGKAKRVYVLTYATSRGDSSILYNPNITQKIR